ncbi:Hypothetical protein NAEGRDRAFT_80176 [Naegleria gruberi]|uniref:S5 DRBM domain-containing protein n=1 Tax=Naegleria gruberi TaxID=5762 RepID=D2VJC9_NAEGR|nr:uncharacterized protein NAEGRDRAFT_80176 [Naegleria gruberi]EFC43017.1 Hypothetical protein NAEGRDRAFT_80176 [Naegleria gruberi]|eukprot:XP_002675761.1 Hypothetical protein NAEGRDRAFT_80176 [Naegleria gruberi strain NEG-M]
MRNIKLLRQLPSSTKKLATKQSPLCFSSIHNSPSYIQSRCFSSSKIIKNSFERISDSELKQMEEKERNREIPAEELNFPTTDNDKDFINIIEAKQQGTKFTEEMFETLVFYLKNLRKEKRHKVVYWLATEKKETKLVRKIKEAFISLSLLQANVNLQLPRAVQKERIWAKYTNFGMFPGTFSQPAETEYNRFKVKSLYDLSKLKTQADLDDLDEMVDEDNISRRDQDEDNENEQMEEIEDEEEVGSNEIDTIDIEDVDENIPINELQEALRVRKDYSRFHELIEEKNEADPERIQVPKSFERVSQDVENLGKLQGKRFKVSKVDQSDMIKSLNTKLLRQERDETSAPFYLYQFDETQLGQQIQNLESIIEGKSSKTNVSVNPIYNASVGVEKGYFGDVDLDADWDESLYEYEGEPAITHPLADDVEDPEIYHGQKDAITDVSFEEKVLKLSRNCKMTTGGRVESYNCLYLVGSYSGLCGVGFGTAASPAVAQSKARKAAYKNIRSIDPSACIPRSHMLEAKFGACKVRIHPSTKEQPTANPILRKLCAYLGLKYCSVRLYGSRNILNVIPAFFKCVDQLRSVDRDAAMRGVMPIYLKKDFEDYLEKVRVGKGLYGW